MKSMRLGSTVSFNRTNPASYRQSLVVVFSSILLASLMWQLTSSFTENSSLAILPNICWIFYAAVLTLGLTMRNRPSVFNLLPISYKQRTVYFYLAMVVIVIFTAIVIALVFLAIFLFTFLIMLIFTGGGILSEGSGIEEEIDSVNTVAIGWQGNLFALFLLLLVIGAATIIILMNNGKLRNVLCFVYPIVQHILLVIMLNIADSSHGITLAGNLFASFKNLPLSWLWLTFFGIISVGVLTYSVIRLIQYHRPKQY